VEEVLIRTGAVPSVAPASCSRRFRWLAFALIFGLLLSDYMSRQVLNAVFPQLKLEWALTDTQLGSLSSIVALMVGILTVPVSLMADRFGRARSLTAMALIWSVATLGCGLAAHYEHMLVARFCVGVGEAAYGSVGLAVLLSIFPPSTRATLTGAFTSGGAFGAVLGVALGGFVAAHFGWRAAFIAMALFGLVVVVVYGLTVTESRLARNRFDAGGAGGRRAGGLQLRPGAMRAQLRGLVSAPSLMCAYFGSGLQLFVPFAMMAWLPSYLNRYYAMPTAKAALGAAILFIIGGTGMLLCGVLTDRIGHRAPARKITLAVIYCLVSSMLFLTALHLNPGPAQLALIGGAMFLASATWGPAGAMVADLAPPAVHATAMAVLTLVNNLVGAAPGPQVTGMLADRVGLLGALQLVPLVSFAAAAVFGLGRLWYLRDLRAVERRNAAAPD